MHLIWQHLDYRPIVEDKFENVEPERISFPAADSSVSKYVSLNLSGIYLDLNGIPAACFLPSEIHSIYLIWFYSLMS